MSLEKWWQRETTYQPCGFQVLFGELLGLGRDIRMDVLLEARIRG